MAQKRKHMPKGLRPLYPLIGKTEAVAVAWLAENDVTFDGTRVTRVYAGGPRTLNLWPPSIAMCKSDAEGRIVEVYGLGDT